MEFCRAGLPRTKSKVLHIGATFPISGKEGWQGGQACQPAVRLAFSDVNSRSDILRNYELKLHWNDSECEPGLGATVMYDLLYNDPTKVLLLAGCSTVSTTIAESAKMWNLLVVSFGGSSPALSDRARFPTLFRTHPSATVHNPTRVKLIQMFGWSRIAILHHTQEVFTSTITDLESKCREVGIEIIARQSFMQEATDAVRNLRRQDARIIVGLFYVAAARKVLCEVYKQGLYGKQHVWFFIGWYEDNWFEVNLEAEGIQCTKEEMRMAAEGHFTTEALNWNQDKQRTISGMTVDDFRRRLHLALKNSGYDIDHGRYPEGYQEAPLAYDAVWATALALNKSAERLAKKGILLEDFNYNDRVIGNEIHSAMNETSFLGISGSVAFNFKGERIALTMVEQLQDGKYVQLAYYDTQTDNLTWLHKERFFGGKAPQDRTIIKEVLRTVSGPLFSAMTAVATIGAATACVVLIVNLVFKDHRSIVTSEFGCLTFLLVGVILLFLAVVLLGIDGRLVNQVQFLWICQGRAWTLATGFSFGFGSLFALVWKARMIVVNSKAKPKKRQQNMTSPALIPLGFVAVDIVLLSVWYFIDPLRRSVESFPLEEPTDFTEDLLIRPLMEHCESKNQTTWLGILFGYKSLILVLGIFLAYETRGTKSRQQDARLAGMAIYNVVVLGLITGPVSLVIASQPDASFAFSTLAIAFCSWISMAIVCVPKIVSIVQNPSSMGLLENSTSPAAKAAIRNDEEKLQRLLSENERLEKLIAEKDEKIMLLRQKIKERELTSKNGQALTTSK
ncbi:gamma-aminobutyric acid type B receptor subunit 1-like isoform X2 [Artemia franciscana]|uniref:gamma-aminobutyric acid type B receptor subunit 1-like isoform X2 n=1 Tax=Artemia franciscana TaxID=6661 RepID=UPI0032DA6F01